MVKTLIFGHKNPDTDSVCSAIVYDSLKKMQGMDTEAVILGNINDETRYALEYFKVSAPRIISSVEKNQAVILVDHNEMQQSADGIDKAIIKEVIDHHRIANFETAQPLYYRGEPLGCTATILKKIFKEEEVEINRINAGLMLSAIISDSLLFKSPTCTLRDKIAAEELAEIAGVDLQEYGLNMLKAGANTVDKSINELINTDSKEFVLNEEDKIVVAQINTVDNNEVIERKEEIKNEIEKDIENRKLSAFVFIITNILTSNSDVIVYGNKADKIAKAFNMELKDNKMFLEGVVSRKKQVIPCITDEFSK